MKIEMGGSLFLLGIAFIVLKLCHVINWSWWLVTLPIYGGLILWAIMFVVIFVGLVMAAYFKQRKKL